MLEKCLLSKHIKLKIFQVYFSPQIYTEILTTACEYETFQQVYIYSSLLSRRTRMGLLGRQIQTKMLQACTSLRIHTNIYHGVFTCQFFNVRITSPQQVNVFSAEQCLFRNVSTTNKLLDEFFNHVSTKRLLGNLSTNSDEANLLENSEAWQRRQQ